MKNDEKYQEFLDSGLVDYVKEKNLVSDGDLNDRLFCAMFEFSEELERGVEKYTNLKRGAMDDMVKHLAGDDGARVLNEVFESILISILIKTAHKIYAPARHVSWERAQSLGEFGAPQRAFGLSSRQYHLLNEADDEMIEVLVPSTGTWHMDMIPPGMRVCFHIEGAPIVYDKVQDQNFIFSEVFFCEEVEIREGKFYSLLMKKDLELTSLEALLETSGFATIGEMVASYPPGFKGLILTV